MKTIFRSFILWFRRKYADHPGIVASAILHIFIILFLIGGLPNFFKDKEKDIIPVSVVLALEKKENTAPKSEPKPAPKKEPPKPKPSPVKKIVSKPKPPPPKPAPKEIPKPAPMPEPKKEAPKPKPAPKKEPPKPKEPKTPNMMDNILKNLEKEIVDSTKPTPVPAPKTPVVEDIDIGMTNREIALIIKQISDNWSMIPTGTGSVQDISVDLRISLARDGAVRDVKIVEQSRYNSPSETFYRAAADSAVRATHRASPFKKLPLRKYETWKELYIVFHPQ